MGKPLFKDLYMNTYTGELPSIMNDNFKEVSTALNTIVEYGENSSSYVKLPVNTSGNVKANVGYFNNLNVKDTLKVEGSLSIDISAIAYDSSTSLKQKIDNIDTSIKDLIKQLEIGRVGGSSNNVNNENVLSAPRTVTHGEMVASSLSVNDANLYINALESDNSYTYNLKYYMINSVVYDPSIYRCKADYADVLNKKMYRYYTVYGNKYIKIDNEYSSCFRNCNVGDVVIPILVPKTEKDFELNLGNQNITIEYADYPITTLQLICTSTDENGKSTFNIVNYTGKIQVL